MKKLISIILALILTFGVSVPCFALGLDAGVDELRTLWSRGNGPEVDGNDIDYSYYSPVENGADDTQKYPLVVIMAGALEGLVEGFELLANELALWTADEFQSRFNNGAAYLLIGRAQEEDEYYWDSPEIMPAFKAAIDDFVANNPNVDTDRIYVLGWCLGGGGAINLSAMYPDFFAASVIICPNREITGGEAEILKDKPVWILGCKKDTYVSYSRVIKKSWNNVLKKTNNPENIRFTTCDTAPGVTLVDKFKFIDNHNIWRYLSYDMRDYKGDEYTGMKTIDGTGKEIENPSMIEWLSSQTLNKDADTTGKLPSKFYRFFNELFPGAYRAKLLLVILHFLDTFGYIDLY